MKYPLPTTGYTFNASSKTITFSGGTVPASIRNILAVVNITRGVTYFTQVDGGGSYSNNILTLTAPMEGHADADALEVWYEDRSTIGPLTDAQLRATALPISGTASAVGFQAISVAQFTRPADTIAYAAQDVVSDSTTAPTLLTFPNVGRANGGSGLILSARHMKSSTTTTGASYRLQLYKTAISAIADNAPFTALYANRLARIGFIDFIHQTGGTGSDASYALAVNQNLPYICDASLASLRGILHTLSANTPTSGEQHTVELSVLQN